MRAAYFNAPWEGPTRTIGERETEWAIPAAAQPRPEE